jgi:hypothetical protein
MKISRLIVLGLYGLALIVCLAGCKITGASPEPGTVITMKYGDTVTFKVAGPVNTPTTRYRWTIERRRGAWTSNVLDICTGKNSCEFTANSETDNTNRVIIHCYYEVYQYIKSCGQTCHWYWLWLRTDSRSWDVRIDPGSGPVVNGDYMILDYTDIQLLDGKTEIAGNLWINGDFKNLKFLDNLTVLKGDLEIYNNDSLTSLDGLQNITSIGGDLGISSNDALTTLTTLGNVTSVSGDLVIKFNNALTSLGMNALLSVGGNYNITDNPILCTSLAEELMNRVLATGGIGGEIFIERNKNCTIP